MNVKQNDQAVAVEFRAVVWLVALGFFIQALDITIISTALPAIAHDLAQDPLKVQSIIVAYVLTVAVAIPLSGWLADRFGIRNVYMSAMLIFSIASLGCALSSTLTQLLIFRVLQGIGGALLLPVGRLALMRILPRDQWLAALSFIAIPGLIGPLIGPAIGGWMVDFASWPWIFSINIVLGCIGALLVWYFIPNIQRQNRARFDLIGFVLLVVAMISCIYGLEQNVRQLSWSLFFYLSLTLVCLICYTQYAKRHPDALFSAELFQVSSFKVGVIGNAVTRLGSAAMPFILPLSLQLGLGFSAFHAGLLLFCAVFASILMKSWTRALIVRFGYRQILLVNTMLLGLSIAAFAFMDQYISLWFFALHLFIFGSFNSLQFTAMNSFSLKDLPEQQAASGNSLLSMVVNITISLGVVAVAFSVDLFKFLAPNATLFFAFQATFVLLGVLSLIAGFVFYRIPVQK